jgi:drug/metabolite transporter (DMT)-like permease
VSFACMGCDPDEKSPLLLQRKTIKGKQFIMPESNSKSYTLGLIFLLIACVLWSCASVLTKYIFNDLSFDSPFLLSWMGTSVFTLFLPLNWFLRVTGITSGPPIPYGFHEGFHSLCPLLIGPPSDFDSDSDTNGSGSGSGFGSRGIGKSSKSKMRAAVYDRLASDGNGSDIGIGNIPGAGVGAGNEVEVEVSYTHYDAFLIACKIAPVWYIANMLYSYSLFWTSISSSTIISNLSATFTLFFSWYVGFENVTYGKLLGILCCFIGAVLVTVHDESIREDSSSSDSSTGSDAKERGALGDLAALVSAMGYGWYTVQLRLSVCEEEDEEEGNDEREYGEDTVTFNALRNTSITNTSGSGSGGATAMSISGSGNGNCKDGAGGLRLNNNSNNNSKSNSNSNNGINGTDRPEPKPIALNLILGYVGLLVTLIGWPALVICAIECWEDMCAMTGKIFLFILLLAFTNNFLSEYFWARCILLTTPTVATVGLSMTIPMAYCIDLFLIKAPGSGSLLGGVGAMFTVLGFLFVNTSDETWMKWVHWLGGEEH